MGSFRFYVREVTILIVCALSRIIPNDRELVVFAQAYDLYSDNSKALFEYLVANGYKARWLTHLATPCSEVASSNFFISRKSALAIWVLSRANVAVISRGVHDFGPWRDLIKQKKILMLWHGIALKHLGVFDPKNDTKKIRNATRHYNAVLATSQVTKYYTSAHESVNAEKVYITGLPRNDVLFRLRKDKNKSMQDVKTFLYAPTFRDFDTQDRSLLFPFVDYDEKKLVHALKCHSVKIALRTHSLDHNSMSHLKKLCVTYPEVFKDYSVEDVGDTANILPLIDGIISDYSSIYIDLLPFNLPCIFVPVDKVKYEEARGLAYDYDMVTPGPKVITQHAFLAAIAEAVVGAPEWEVQRRFARKFFHHFEDDNSSYRVARVIDELMFLV